jgi:hypothetical protein
MPTMGSTLEAVPLRSSLPTGRMTMRYQIPALHVSHLGDVTMTSTTPKVVVPVIDVTTSDAGDETAARKGGEAR